MKNISIEITPDEEVGGFTAQIPGIPAYGEGKTEEGAIADLKEAVSAYISAFGIQDALANITRPALRTLNVSLEEFSRA
jgi:predicted RNase H-like HicB family nuclease